MNPVTAAHQCSVLYNGDTPLVPKFKIIDAAGSGDNELVAAVTGKKIRVIALSLTMTGTLVTIRLESSAGGAALTGQMGPLAGNSITLPFSPVGWCETVAGQSLNMELSGAQSVDGLLVYVEI